MVEAYAFLAAFTVQVVAMSLLHPAWFIRAVREHSTRYPAERFAQFYPGVDLSVTRQRFLTRYRALNSVIAVLGLLLLSWLFSHMRRPAWDDDPVLGLLAVYFVVQISPICLVAWSAARFKNKVLELSSPEARRKATLQPRGVFDFVSPAVVVIAVLSYFLFAAFVIYIQTQPFPGFALIGVLTLVYALEAFVIYTTLYGKKINPLETSADSVHMSGQGVKACVYGCIVCVVFFSVTFTLDLLDLKRWMPFALTVCLLACSLLCLMAFSKPPRHTAAEGSGSDRSRASGT